MMILMLSGIENMRLMRIDIKVGKQPILNEYRFNNYE